MDITIRRLSDQLWYMRKIGPFTLLRRAYKTVMVDEHSHQIIDGYRLAKGIWLVLQPLRLLGLSFFFPQLKSWSLCFRPFYYRYFKSWDTPEGVPLKYVYDREKAYLGLKEKVKSVLIDRLSIRRHGKSKEEVVAEPPQDKGA